LVPPAVFLASYVATYQQVPTFPPVGAVNKIFYIALVAVLVGFVLDLLKTTKLDRVFAMVVPGLIVGWIGLPRFANGDLEAVTAGCAPWLGGSGIMATESGREIDCRTQRWEPGRHCNANGTHARFRAGCTPRRVVSQLDALAVAGLGAVAIWEFLIPREGFGASSVLGAGSGFFAVVSTVTLITRRIDGVGLALLLLILYAGQLGAWLLLPPNRIHGRARQALVGLMADSPVLAVLAILLLRHPEFSASMRAEQ